MSKETFALINDKDQVVNHIVIDKDDAEFENNMAAQLTHWNCVRYVETTETNAVIILDESPEIWTTHSEELGFILPDGTYISPVTNEIVQVRTKKASDLPADSLLLEINAANRPDGWTFPEGLTIIYE